MRILKFSMLFFLVVNTALAQTVPVKFFIRGTGLNRNANRILQIGDQTVYSTGGRGLRLTILNKSDQAVIYDTSFDCYGSTSAADGLADKLNTVTNGQICVLTSYDAWEGQVTAKLDAAFYRLGLTVAGATRNSDSRRPYAAIFEGATSGEKSAKVVEISTYKTNNQPYAEICGFLFHGTFLATGSQTNALFRPQGNEIGVLVDYMGQVGIGTTSPKANLDVSGTIKATEIKVEAQTADFVFEEDYRLKELSEVEAFIKANKHLPEIPSAAEMEATGVNLAEMNKLLLMKVEELTLYAIKQYKELESKATEVRKLKSSFKKLEEEYINTTSSLIEQMREIELQLSKP